MPQEFPQTEIRQIKEMLCLSDISSNDIKVSANVMTISCPNGTLIIILNERSISFNYGSSNHSLLTADFWPERMPKDGPSNYYNRAIGFIRYCTGYNQREAGYDSY